MNGTAILTKEVADDIKALNAIIPPKTCNFAGVVKDGLIRALRLGEDAMSVSRQNRIMLIALLAMFMKNDPHILKFFHYLIGMMM